MAEAGKSRTWWKAIALVIGVAMALLLLLMLLLAPWVGRALLRSAPVEEPAAMPPHAVSAPAHAPGAPPAPASGASARPASTAPDVQSTSVAPVTPASNAPGIRGGWLSSVDRFLAWLIRVLDALGSFLPETAPDAPPTPAEPARQDARPPAEASTAETEQRTERPEDERSPKRSGDDVDIALEALDLLF